MRISHSKLRSSFPDSTSVEEDFPSTETIPETMVLEPENLSLPNSAPSKVARQKSISRRVSFASTARVRLDQRCRYF